MCFASPHGDLLEISVQIRVFQTVSIHLKNTVQDGIFWF
jgi:hypothetical protein